MEDDQKKKHRAPKAGTKAEKKKAKKQDQRNPSTVESGRARNPKVRSFDPIPCDLSVGPSVY